jgi:hypothetical protein
MRLKITALAVAAFGAAVLATTAAMALRLPDDVYYYSGVTRSYGYTPSHHFLRYGYPTLFWGYPGAAPTCWHRDHHGIRRAC